MDWLRSRLAEDRDLWLAIACLFLYLIFGRLGQILGNLKPILYLLQRKHERETGDEIISGKTKRVDSKWWRRLVD